MKVVFAFEYSDEFVKKTLVETGERLTAGRIVETEASALTPEERKYFLVGSGAWKHAEGCYVRLKTTEVVPADLTAGAERFVFIGCWEYDGDASDVHAVLAAYRAYQDERVREEEARKAEWAAKEAEQKAERVAKEAAERLRKSEARAEQDARLAALGRWVDANGSDLLKARCRHPVTFEWEGLAVAEYAEAVAIRAVGDLAVRVPESFGNQFDRVKVEDSTTPDLAAILLLEAVRARIEAEGLAEEVTADLVWVSYWDDDDYECDDQVKRTELHVEVASPIGPDYAPRNFYFEIPKAE